MFGCKDTEPEIVRGKPVVRKSDSGRAHWLAGEPPGSHTTDRCTQCTLSTVQSREVLFQGSYLFSSRK